MPREMEDHIRENVKSVQFTTGAIIQKEKVLCNHIYFIEKGVVRIYHGERTTQFKKENEFIISYFSDEGIAYDAPGVEALEDTTVWDFTPLMLESTCKRFDFFHEHLRVMMAKDMDVVLKLNSLAGYSDAASLLYDYLRGHTPDLLDRVTPKYLASFLGVSEKVFSHIRRSNIRTGMSGKHLRRDFS